MKKAYLPVLSVCLILLFSGCAYQSQKVTFEPQISVEKLDIGKGQKVNLTVVDERDSESLGRRGAAFMRGAEISTEQDLAGIVRTELSKGLTNYNFVAVTAEEEAPVSIKAEVRSLEYSTSTGFWTGGVHIKGAMKILGEKEADKFDKLYRVEKEKRVVFVPGADKNEQMMNEALTELLEEILNDQEFIDFLKI